MGTRIAWRQHPERDALLKRLVADHQLSWAAIAEQVGYSADACRHRARRADYKGWEVPRANYQRDHITPQISTPKAARLSGAELWRHIEEATDRDVARHEAERLIDVVIDDERPIALTFKSDQHIRQTGPIMVRRMREDAELIARTEGLYAVLAGDGVDNHIKHREAMANGGDKPAASWRAYDHYISLFADKILVLHSGNHDDWTRDATGVDQVAALAEKNRVHYTPDEALIRLQLGRQPYQILSRHQFFMNSRMNLGHAVKRLWEMGNDDFDVGVLGHHHEAACEPFMKHGIRRYALRPGSYQLTSSYSRRKGFPHAYPTCPTVILWPDRRQVIGFWDAWEAAGYLTWLRAEWPRSDLRRPAA